MTKETRVCIQMCSETEKVKQHVKHCNTMHKRDKHLHNMNLAHTLVTHYWKDGLPTIAVNLDHVPGECEHPIAPERLLCLRL